MGRVVLVTGVSRYLGGLFASRLSGLPDVDTVIGIDLVPPKSDLGDVRFVRADIRNPIVGDVISDDDVDTIVHLGVVSSPVSVGGRASMKETNVIGTMQVLAAAQRAPSVRRLVVKSSTHVYGASAKDPAVLTEDTEPRRLPRSGYPKDCVEIEGYVRGFARRRSDVTVTMLRCASLIGPAVDTSLTRYLSLPVIPTVLGFDPRLQFCHVDDVLGSLERAVAAGVHGTFNIAGAGVLSLSQVVRRLGRPWVALPAALLPSIAAVVPQLRSADLSSDQVAFLSHGRTVDTTAAEKVLGYVSRFSTEEAFADFMAHRPTGPLTSDRLDAVEREAREVLGKVVHNVRR